MACLRLQLASTALGNFVWWPEHICLRLVCPHLARLASRIYDLKMVWLSVHLLGLGLFCKTYLSLIQMLKPLKVFKRWSHFLIEGRLQPRDSKPVIPSYLASQLQTLLRLLFQRPVDCKFDCFASVLKLLRFIAQKLLKSLFDWPLVRRRFIYTWTLKWFIFLQLEGTPDLKFWNVLRV
jgi:hypothetical protein